MVRVILDQAGIFYAYRTQADGLNLHQGIVGAPVCVSGQVQVLGLEGDLHVAQELPAGVAVVALLWCGGAPGEVAGLAVVVAPELADVPDALLPLVVDLGALVVDHPHLPVGARRLPDRLDAG